MSFAKYASLHYSSSVHQYFDQRCPPYIDDGNYSIILPFYFKYFLLIGSSTLQTLQNHELIGQFIMRPICHDIPTYLFHGLYMTLIKCLSNLLYLFFVVHILLASCDLKTDVHVKSVTFPLIHCLHV